jgi:hypothetical protein
MVPLIFLRRAFVPVVLLQGPPLLKVEDGPTGRSQSGEDGRRLLTEGVRAVAQRCRDRGLEPTFHHHMGTCIETPEEIDRFLMQSSSEKGTGTMAEKGTTSLG